MNPICIKCRQMMDCKKNGVLYVNMHEGQPVKATSGDLYNCSTCDNGVIMLAPKGRHDASRAMHEAENRTTIFLQDWGR